VTASALVNAAEAESRARERVDLGVGGKAPEPLLGKDERAVDGNLEHAAARPNQRDLGLGERFEPGSRTESVGLVASLPAVFDLDLHGTSRCYNA